MFLTLSKSSHSSLQNHYFACTKLSTLHDVLNYIHCLINKGNQLTGWYHTEHHKVQVADQWHGPATMANNESEGFTKKLNRTLITQIIIVITSTGLQIWPNVVSTKVVKISGSPCHTVSLYPLQPISSKTERFTNGIYTVPMFWTTTHAMQCFMMPFKHSTPYISMIWCPDSSPWMPRQPNH